MLKELGSSIGSVVIIGVFLLGQFPGGTILMAIKCDSHRLTGWDWVLSVIIPFFGVFKALFSSAC